MAAVVGAVSLTVLSLGATTVGSAAAAPGGLDATFGSAGTVAQAGTSGATGVAVVPAGLTGAGDVVVSASGGFDVARFTGAGALDKSFGSTGLVTNTFPSGSANAVAVVPAGLPNAGDVVVVGDQTGVTTCGGNEQPVVAEYTTAGALNTAFGTNTPRGTTNVTCPGVSPSSNFGGTLNSVTIDATGKVVVAGQVTTSNGTVETLVARLLSSGAPDSTFGTNGVTAQAIGDYNSAAAAVAVTATDVYTAGYSYTGSAEYMSTAAFATATGSLDASFMCPDQPPATRTCTSPTPGVVTTSTQAGSSGSAVVVMPGGNVVTGGSAPVAAGGSNGFFLASYLPSGTPVGGFGTNGQELNTPALTTNDEITALAYQPLGNVLVAAGSASSGSTQEMVVTQYNATTGAVNTHFGTGGAVTHAFQAGPSGLAAVAIQPDGKAVGAGTAPIVNAAPGIGLIRVLGPTLSVAAPPTYDDYAVSPSAVTLNFTASIDEPLFGSVAASFCASAGAVVNGQAQCGTVTIPAGATSVSVPVTITVTNTAGNSQTVLLTANSSGGLSASLTAGTAIATIQHLPPPHPLGYWMVASDGGIFNYGHGFYGSAGNIVLNRPVVGMAGTADAGGYWLVASDGGIFNYGDATFYGSAGNIRLNQPIVGMAATPDGNGYWLVAADGGIFTYGDAGFLGSAGNIRLNQPIVGMAADPGSPGYWLVSRDGGIFNYGAAPFEGSAGNIRLNQPIVGMAATPDGGGYWLASADGGIFNYGDAPFDGSAGNIHLNKPIVGVAS